MASELTEHFATRGGASWRAALLAVALSGVAVSTPARADCFLSGSTITCMAPGTAGFVNATGDNLALTVQPGTTVVDNGFAAIQLRDFNVITNNGTIAAGDNAAGIVVDDDSTIRNNAVISAGADGAGITADDRNAVTNAGSISVGDGGAGFGIAVGVNSTVVNSGTINVGQAATAIAAAANTTLPASDSIVNSGGITLGDLGIGVIANENHRILNSGTITGGLGSIGIQGLDNNVVTNTGTITVGMFGSGVQFRNAGNVLNNYGTIRAVGGAFSIDACACSSVNNTFNNMAGGTLDGYILVDGAGNSVINNGLITITDPNTALIGYPTFVIMNTGGAGAGSSFVQTTSGTLALRMDNTGLVDNLSADAITARGTLRIALQNQLYANTTFSGTGVGLTVYGTGTLGNTVTSGFDRYVASSPFFTVTPIYDSGDATNYTSISFQLDRLGFGSVPGMTDNQRAVGNALEPGYSPGLTGYLATFYANLFAATSLNVLDQLSGAGTAAAQDGAFATGSQFNGMMMQQVLSWLNGAPGSTTFSFGAPLGYAAAAKNKFANKPGHDAFAAMPARAPAEQGLWRAWTLGFGGARAIDGESGTANQSSTTFGGAFGVDRQLSPDLLLGFAAGGSSSHFSVSELTTSGRINAGHIGAYAVQRMGAAYVAATVNYARGDTSTERTITGVGPTEIAKGRFASDQLSGRVEIGRKYGFTGYSLTPFVALEPAVLWQHAYAENSTTLGGAPGVLGLSYGSNTVTSLPLLIGAQIDARHVLSNGQTLSPYARLSWVHEFKPERSITASFISIPGAAFTADGARPSSDALRIEAGGTLTLSRKAALFANINSELSDRSRSLAATAGVRTNW